VACERFVTILARVKDPAASHLYGDDVERAIVVGAACLRVEIETGDFRALAFRRREVVVRY
jgi:hypothetical protein